MSQQRIRILIVDDHPSVLAGLRTFINPEPDMEVVAAARNGPEAVQLFRQTQPDITVMDLLLSKEMTGIDAIKAIRRECANASIVALSALGGDDLIHRAMEAGAKTYLLKEQLGDNLPAIIRQIYAGETPMTPEVAQKLAYHASRPELTPREVEVLNLMARGKSNKQIATLLGVSYQTIQFHAKNMFAKLDVSGRTEAIKEALRRDIIASPED